MKYIIALLIAVDIAINISNNQKLKKVMADQQQFLDVISRIDKATSTYAQQIRDLKSQIAGQGLPASVEDDILKKLTDTANKLNAVGQDPQNPVPDTAGSSNDAGTGSGTGTGTDAGTSDAGSSGSTDSGSTGDAGTGTSDNGTQG